MTEAGEAALTRLRQWPGEHRVAVGLSGGVDSSLTAALLVEAGWEVEGLTLWLMSGKGACCAEGLVDAAGICEQLGIPHHVVDTRETFQKEIVQRLVDGYQDGITPLPCSSEVDPSAHVSPARLVPGSHARNEYHWTRPSPTSDVTKYCLGPM